MTWSFPMLTQSIWSADCARMNFLSISICLIESLSAFLLEFLIRPVSAATIGILTSFFRLNCSRQTTLPWLVSSSPDERQGGRRSRLEQRARRTRKERVMSHTEQQQENTIHRVFSTFNFFLFLLDSYVHILLSSSEQWHKLFRLLVIVSACCLCFS